MHTHIYAYTNASTCTCVCTMCLHFFSIIYRERVCVYECSDSLRSHDYSPLGISVPAILLVRILGWVTMPFSGILPSPGNQLTSLASFIGRWIPYTAEPPGKPNIQIEKCKYKCIV